MSERVLGPNQVLLSKFFPSVSRDLVITRPEELFFPDEWAQCYAAGLTKLPERYNDLSSSVFFEVGVGTGVIPAGVLLDPKMSPALVIGSDIKLLAVEETRRLLNGAGLTNRSAFMQSDLLQDVPEDVLRGVDHFTGCIPQVKRPKDVDLTQGDNYAHYYESRGSHWDEFGLDLNAAFIQQATDFAPQSSITLNLSGRAGLPKLLEMFRAFGRDADVLHHEMVPQHGGTSLETMVQVEAETGHAYEFFGEEIGCTGIDATEAEKRRLAHEPVFHKIYVLHAPAL